MSKTVRMLVSMAGAYESYAPGDLVHVSDETAKAWEDAGIATPQLDGTQKVSDLQPEPAAEELKHLGGGYYELPNGEKIRGKEKAEAALEELKKAEEEAKTAGDVHDDESGNAADAGTGDADGSEGTPAG